MKALIDGDLLVYWCGFASDQRMYTCEDGATFGYKRDAKAHCEKNGLSEETITKSVQAEPLEHTLHSVKLVINKIMESANCDTHRIFLTAREDGYREKLATILPYKGNREDAHKPIHYDAIRDYLMDVQGATVVSGGIEADDALGVFGSADPKGTVICTNDKDLDMIPGTHYNWQKDVLYEVSYELGMDNFYNQLLTGDRVDNIAGCPGIGPVKASQILAVGNAARQDRICSVGREYAVHYSDPEQALEEHIALLWIQREEGEVPGIKDFMSGGKYGDS